MIRAKGRMDGLTANAIIVLVDRLVSRILISLRNANEQMFVAIALTLSLGTGDFNGLMFIR